MKNRKKENTSIVTKTETYGDITLDVQVRVCKCGTDLFDEELDFATLDRIQELQKQGKNNG
jgi:hypothetical protein